MGGMGDIDVRFNNDDSVDRLSLLCHGHLLGLQQQGVFNNKEV